MKSLKFISSTNGLKVSIPGDAVPTPNCGKVMCTTGEYTGCLPQPSWAESPVVFSFVAGTDGDSEIGFRAGGLGFGTLIDPFDGASANPNLLYVTYRVDLGTMYTNLNVIDAAGPATVRVIAPNGQSHLFTGNVNTGEFQAQGAASMALVAGQTYCVVVTFTVDVE